MERVDVTLGEIRSKQLKLCYLSLLRLKNKSVSELVFFSQLLPSQKYGQNLLIYHINGACGKPHGFPNKKLNSWSHLVCNLRLIWKWIFFPVSVLMKDGLKTWWSGVMGVWSTTLSPPLFILNLCSLSVMKQKVRA